jgi:hypothetical protein
MSKYKFSVVALVAAGLGLIACGSSGGDDAGGTGGTISGRDTGATGGSGGGTSYDAGLDVTLAQPDTAIDAVAAEDRPSQPTEAGTALDGPPVSTSACFDCTGLTVDQCHDKIINVKGCALDPSIVTQDPGPDPAVPFPTCSAI